MKNLFFLGLLMFVSINCSALYFGEVEKGHLYRCFNVSNKCLDAYIKRCKAKTVINLYSLNEDGPEDQKMLLDDDALEEKKEAQDTKVAVITIPMRTGELPSRQHLLDLLKAYRTAERPILLRGDFGEETQVAIAAFLWVMVMMKKTKREAIKLLFDRCYFSTDAASLFFMQIWEGEEWLEGYGPQDYQRAFNGFRCEHCAAKCGIVTACGCCTCYSVLQYGQSLSFPDDCNCCALPEWCGYHSWRQEWNHLAIE